MLVPKCLVVVVAQTTTQAFEATLDAWMDEFHYYLQYSTPMLAETDPERESPPDGVKAAVCASLHLFMEKNEEEFEKYLQRFASDVWQLLVGVTQKPGQVGVWSREIDALLTFVCVRGVVWA